MGKQFRTAQGQYVDVDTMRLLNEGSVAVGNMNVNARGDQVSPDGTVIKSRNEIMKDHYSSIQPVVTYNPNGRGNRPFADGTLPEAVTTEPAKIEEVQPDLPPEPVLRGSLANSVSIDLTNEAPAKVTRTITRI